jgi:hypothetical protein
MRLRAEVYLRKFCRPDLQYGKRKAYFQNA